MEDTANSHEGRGRRKKKDAFFEQDTQMIFQHDTLLSALTVSDSEEFESLKEEIATKFGHRSPVSSLIEMGQYLRKTVNFVDVGLPQGSAHSPIFTMNAVVGGEPFPRVKGKNKRECKTGAAYLAWKELVQQQKSSFRKILRLGNRSFNDLVAAFSHLEYLNLVERNPAAFCGKKVLAAFLLNIKNEREQNETIRVVSLGMGNRCIMSQHLCTHGTAVNDSHAEIIARRSLVKFFLKELEQFYTSQSDTIFERSEAGKVRLKPGVTLHLYISTAPCGDSALFSRTESDLNAHQGPIFTNDTQGLLRSKIEAGEGCLPIRNHLTQSLVSLKFGQQLRTMSCSDKVCKWNVLGVQGALLSHLMDPVYMESITIGSVYVYGHIARAVSQRLGKDQAQYMPSVPTLDLPYRCHLPRIGHSPINSETRETEHSLATCVAWNCSTDVIDVFDGVVGKATEGLESSRVPSISKKLIFEDFKRLCSKFPERGMLGNTYLDSKVRALDYQKAKVAMYCRLEELGYGAWLKKPQDLELFD